MTENVMAERNMDKDSLQKIHPRYPQEVSPDRDAQAAAAYHP